MTRFKIRALCRLDDKDLQEAINNHPLYNAWGRINSGWAAMFDSCDGWLGKRIFPLPRNEVYRIQGLVDNGCIDCNAVMKSEEEAYKLFLALVDYGTNDKIGSYYAIRHRLTGEIEYTKRTAHDQFRGMFLSKMTQLDPLEFVDLVREQKIIL